MTLFRREASTPPSALPSIAGDRTLRGVTPTMLISEIFCSVQGEGLLVGTPSVFVRTSGCNLRCVFCDTPYTSWRSEGDKRELDAILAEVARHAPVRHVVLTGGEPMIAPAMPALAEGLAARGYHVTVETAGTVFTPMPVDLWSVSPKLASSTPGADAGPWRERHERARRRPDVVAAMMAAGPYQLKFVVTGPEDLAEIEAFVAEVGAEADRVLLMPEGVDVAALDRGARWIVPACIERGWRFADRLHVRLFGHTRGT